MDVALFEDPEGPIERFSWGVFVIRGETHGQTATGRVGAGKDIRVVGEKVKRWREREGHRLKKSMIARVYDKGVEALVIGTGVEGGIEAPDKVRRSIARHGIPLLVVEPTAEACRVYNQLWREGKRVALLAHGSC